MWTDGNFAVSAQVPSHPYLAEADPGFSEGGSWKYLSGGGGTNIPGPRGIWTLAVNSLCQ